MPTSTPTLFSAANERDFDAFGKRLTARLNGGLLEVHPDVGERLRFARMKALYVRRAALSTFVPARSVVMGAEYALAGGNGGGDGNQSGGRRAAMVLLSFLAFIMFSAALIGIDRHTANARAQEVAEVDTALLLDVLPPSAYTDSGFMHFLRQRP